MPDSSILNNPVALGIIGFLFCLAGGYSFFTNIYEEGKSVKWPLLIMLMGVMLIALGTAKYYRLL